MSLNKLKYFNITEVDKKLWQIEEECNTRINVFHAYIELEKLRYINVSSLIGMFMHILLNYRRNSLASLLLLNPKKVVKIIWLLLSKKRVYFHSTADIVHVRNNLSLFYLNKRERIKVHLDGGVRTLNDFRNEIKVLYWLKKSDIDINVPNFNASVIRNDLVYYKDQIIFGKAIGWHDNNAESVLITLIKTMFIYYRKRGIFWKTLSQNDPELSKIIVDLLRKNGAFSREGVSISENIVNKKIAWTYIHGDLSLGNVIMKNDSLYVIDWELSCFKPICMDIYKIISRKPNLSDFIEGLLLESERVRVSDSKSNDASFKEQILLEEFIRKNLLKINGDIEIDKKYKETV